VIIMVIIIKGKAYAKSFFEIELRWLLKKSIFFLIRKKLITQLIMHGLHGACALKILKFWFKRSGKNFFIGNF